MTLIFIRHGDPDYKNDCLTEKGRREAELLALRTEKWQVDGIYVSPMGRARETAQPCLSRMGRSATQFNWLREIPGRVILPDTGETHIP